MNKKNMTNRYPGVALIGLGYWGQNLLRSLNQLPLSRIVIHDLASKRVQQAQELVPKAEFYTSFKQVLMDPSLEGICVASPVKYHAEHVIAGLKAGKHVFVEKPLCGDVQEAKRIERVAKATKRHVMVGHIYTHHPAVLKLKEWIRNGKLGKILWIRSIRCSLGPRVRDDVDVLWDYAIHDAYLIPFLLDRKVKRARADGRAHLKPPRSDWVEFSLEFENSNTTMHGFVSWLDAFKERKLTLVGQKGIAVFDEAKQPCLTFYRCGFTKQRGTDSWGNRDLKLFDEGKEEYFCETNQTLKLELEHFTQHLRCKQTPRASLADGLTTLKLLETLSRSLKQKGIWLSV